MSFKFIDTVTIKDIDRKPLEYMLKQSLPMPMHTVGMLSSRGGMGKTFLGLRVAAEFVQEQNRSVLAWFSEDEAEIIAFRFDKTVQDFKIDPKVQEKIHYVTTPPTQIAKKEQGVFKANYNALIEIRKDCVMNNVGLVIIDPLLAFYGGDENDNSMARVFMQVFMEWAKQDKVNILFIHHGNKGDGGTRGAGAFTDATRFTYELHYPESEDGETDFDLVEQGFRQVRLVKDNHFVFQHFKKLCIPNTTEANMRILPRYNPEEATDGSAGKHLTYTGANDDIPVEITEYKMDPEEDEFADLLVTVSTSNHITENFVPQRVYWFDLPDLMKSGVNYASGSYQNGYREAKNYSGDAETVMLDIDDGMTIQEAQEAFKDFKAIIVTTKSHQKMKSGKICDRYRVILKTKGAIALDHNQFRDMMEQVHNFFGGIDPQTKDASRFYYSSPANAQVIWIDGPELFEWDRFHKMGMLEQEKKQKEREEIESHKRRSGNSNTNHTGGGKPKNTLPKDYLFYPKTGATTFQTIRDTLSPGAKVTVQCRQGIPHEDIPPEKHHSAVIMKQQNGNVTYRCSGARCAHEETMWCED